MRHFCSKTVPFTAFVARRVQTGESDLVVSLLTREHGRIDAFARGARKSRRRFQGGFSPCILYRGMVSPPARSSLWSLGELEIQEAFPTLLTRPARAVVGQYATELVRDVSPAEDPAPELFDILETFFRRLDESPTPAWGDWYRFEMQVFTAAGIVPCVTACVRCRQEDVGTHWKFHAGAGGIVCPTCAGTQELPSWNPAWTHALQDENGLVPQPDALMRLLGRFLEMHGLRLQARPLCFDLFAKTTEW